MSDQLDAKQVKMVTGVLIIIALCLVAFALGKMFGAGIGWLFIAVIMLWRAKAMRDGINKGGDTP